jgi:hypothetical protein
MDHRVTETTSASRPWEMPGACRRDCEPHRGRFLWWLGIAAFAPGTLCFIPLVGGLFSPLCLALGLPVWLLARHDLALMRQGLMDPRGRAATDEAATLGVSAVAVALVSAVAWGSLWVLIRQSRGL